MELLSAIRSGLDETCRVVLPRSTPRSAARHLVRDGAALTLDLGGAKLGGAWVTISFRDVGSGNLPRLLMTALADAPTVVSLQEEAEGNDWFAWTGRLPDAVQALRLMPLAPERQPLVTEVTIRRRARFALAVKAMVRDPATAARAIYWRSIGLKVRGRGLLMAALRHRSEAGYGAWIARFDTLTEADRRGIRDEIAGWQAEGRLPLISVLMPVYDPAPTVLEAALQSVRAQLYPHWELCIVDDASTDPATSRVLARHAGADQRIRVIRRSQNGHIARATNDALALAQGSHVAFLDHDDVLAENALYHVAAAIRTDPDRVLIYSDEDKIDLRGRRFEPHFKSAFDRELLYGQNYINHLSVLSTARVRELGGLRPGFEGSQDHDLLLRATAGVPVSRIHHIPRVLYHWRAADGSGTFSDRALAQSEAARLQALSDIVAPSGGQAVRGPLGFNRFVRPLPEHPPRVSVIIPTRDRAELLEVVLRGLFEATDYPDIEVVVVDNGSVEPRTRALFDAYVTDPRLHVIAVPGPFNFSDLSNRGAAAATGPVLLFLNNDIEVIEPRWLHELVSIALDPEIGAVGAKLLYPDGTVQHGGIVLGIGGVAGHSHLGLPGTDPGYFARMVLAQEVSAVTGACLAMRACVFAEAGGFDAAGLAVAFNDVDLCLRVRAAGYRIVWTPYARLVHHESKSRGAEDTLEKRARFEAEVRVMQDRWGAQLRADPYYNLNLSRAAAHFRL